MRPGNEFIRRRAEERLSKCTSLLSMEIELASAPRSHVARDSSVRSRVRAQFCKWICAIAKLAERSALGERKKSSRTVLSLPTNLDDSVRNFFVIELISYPRRDLDRFSPIRHRYLLKVHIVACVVKIDWAQRAYIYIWNENVLYETHIPARKRDIKKV